MLPNRNPLAGGSLAVLAAPNANNEAPVSAGAGAGAGAETAGEAPNLKLVVDAGAEKSDLRGETSFSWLVPRLTGAGSAGRGLMLAPNTVSFLSPEPPPKLKPPVPELREKAPPPTPPPLLGVLLPKLKASVPKLGVFGFWASDELPKLAAGDPKTDFCSAGCERPNPANPEGLSELSEPLLGPKLKLGASGFPPKPPKLAKAFFFSAPPSPTFLRLALFMTLPFISSAVADWKLPASSFSSSLSQLSWCSSDPPRFAIVKDYR